METAEAISINNRSLVANNAVEMNIYLNEAKRI